MDEDKQNTPAAPSNQPATETSQQPQPSAHPQTVMAGGKPNKKPLIITIVLGVVLLLIGAAFGLYMYFINTPDYLLNRAITQLSQEEAVAAQFKITTGTEAVGTTISGDFAARGDGQNGEAIIGFGSGDSRVTLTTRVFEEDLFLQLGNLENLGTLANSFSPEYAAALNTPEFAEALEQLNGKWYTITQDDLASLAGEAPENVGGSVTPEDLKRLYEIYENHKFFRANQTFADETIDGVNTAHFTIKMDTEAYEAFLTELKDANLEAFALTDEDVTAAEQAAASFAEDAAVDLWVARGSQKLKQLAFTNHEQGNEGSLTLTFVTDFPELEALERPEDARPFSEFFTTFFGPSFLSTDASTLQELEYY